MKKQDKIDALKSLRKEASIRLKYYFIGLCGIIFFLYNTDNISKEQKEYLYKLIPKRRPFDGYCWRIGAKSPRIKWINEQIKKLERK